LFASLAQPAGKSACGKFTRISMNLLVTPHVTAFISGWGILHLKQRGDTTHSAKARFIRKIFARSGDKASAFSRV
jgi:hypothetical protein